MTVAALYVDRRGPYFGRPDVDAWDVERDARLYAGPWPVVAHPPCARWGRYWFGGPSARERRTLGDDGGCFAAALASVRRWGGVLEHPEGSHAWRTFGIKAPKAGGWVPASLWDGGWTCCVEQGHYGHRARKATWLYAVGCELPELRWGASVASVRLYHGYHTAEERRHRSPGSITERMGKLERALTPTPFADLLLSLARTAAGQQRATPDGRRHERAEGVGA